MAITTYTDELSTPLGVFDRVGAWFARLTKSMQYAQMMRALSQLDNAQLAKIGIRRSDIPAYAEKAVYQNV